MEALSRHEPMENTLRHELSSKLATELRPSGRQPGWGSGRRLGGPGSPLGTSA